MDGLGQLSRALLGDCQGQWGARGGLNSRGTARRCHFCRQLLRYLTTAIPKANQQHQGKRSENPLWAMDKSFPAIRAQYWPGKEPQPPALQPPTHFICSVQLGTGYCIFNWGTGRRTRRCSYFIRLLLLLASPSSSSEERIWWAWGCRGPPRLILMLLLRGEPGITSCPEPGSMEDKESVRRESHGRALFKRGGWGRHSWALPSGSSSGSSVVPPVCFPCRKQLWSYRFAAITLLLH